MNAKKILLPVLLSLGVAASTNAAVITFDDLPETDAGLIENGYAGFDWTSFGYANKSVLPGSGYETGVVSGDYAAYNDFAETSSLSGSLFDFNGAFLTGAWNDGLNIEVKGFLSGAELYSTTVVVNTSIAQWFDFNFLGIDGLSFRAFGGENNILLGGEGEQFVMDNFTINEPASVPESSPIALLLVGIASLLLGRRMQRS
jgi:hypothetical protein